MSLPGGNMGPRVIERTQARIRVLDPHVINQIAAGEVIERPASVVKELVENAIDAHASRVEIFVEGGGSRLLRVVDDGEGMAPEDLAAAFLPHATSKLSSAGDLESIATLGFRGEALASIGAVSHAEIVSRPADAGSGHRVEDRGGAISPPRAAAAAAGTEVTVRNLFFNTPARARFLRSARTEFGHIEDLCIRFALAYPSVGFRLVSDGTEVLRTEAGESRRDRFARLFGREFAEGLIEATASAGIGSLEAWLARPSVSRPNAQELHFFVNGRWIRDRVLLRVVRDAYRDAMHHGRYPVAFLFLEVDPAWVDVNVHPTKSEVRWRDARFLHTVVAPALQAALRDADHAVPGGAASPPAGAENARIWAPRGAEEGRPDGGPAPIPRMPAPPLEVREPAPSGSSSGGRLRVLQMHDSYLVCEAEDGIVIVDQHALHERIQYDRILRRLTEGGVAAQRLLVPEEIAVTREEQGLLSEHEGLLRRCGIEWSDFGAGSIALETIPAAIPRERAGELVRDLLGLLRVRGVGADARTLFHDVADTMACKAAVRFGDRLSAAEAEALLLESGALARAFVCPHGRPVLLRLGFADLERHFRRR